MQTKPTYKELAKQVNELETELKQAKGKMVIPSCPFELSKVIDHLHTVSVKDENGIYVFINKFFTDKFGLTENDILGKTDYDLLSKEEADLYRKENLLILETGESIEREIDFFWDGKKQCFIIRKFLVTSIEGSDKFVAIIGTDITDRKKAEEQIQSSQERFKTLFDKAPLGYQSLDEAGCFVEVNHTWLDTLGYTKEEVLGKSFGDILHPDWTDHFNENFPRFKAIGEILGVEFEMIRKDGSSVLMSINGKIGENPDGSFKQTHCVLNDITERRRTELEKQRIEERLQHVDKMETIGIMAGGIAHDFNNLLSVILGNIDMAEKDAAPGSPQAKVLNAAIRATQRAASLTKKFITFSSGGSPVKKTISFQEFLKDTVNIALSGSNIQCGFSIDQDLEMVEIDQDQMGQAIGNIITNAKEAMPRGGTILITARNMSDEQMAYEAGLKLQDDFFIKITVEDQGEGILKKNLNKIFDPYFSRKERGIQKGMGLGLTIANSIINKHGGHIQVESEEGKGTTVSIYLPALQQNEASVCQSTDKVVDSPPKVREKKTTKILIMDDEKMLRDMTQDLLGRLSYEQVEVAAHGEDALNMYIQARGQDEPFDLLLLDLTIKGGMGGEETIQRLHEINPEVRAIICSGYSNDPVVVNYAAYGFIGVLAKPFSHEQLSNAIIQALDKKMIC